MAGYFENSGMMGATDTANSAADDFNRLSGMSPGNFKKPAIFDRLFGGKPAKAVATAPSAMSLPDAPSPSGQPTPNTASTTPALSSGKSLLARVLDASDVKNPKYNASGEPLVPGTPYTTQQFMQALTTMMTPQEDPMVAQSQFLHAQPRDPGVPGGAMGSALGAAIGAAPQPLVQSQPGAQGAMSVPTYPGRAAFLHYPQHKLTAAPFDGFEGHATGGYFARGGYPEHLIHGLPTRFESGDYVQPDGRGDGRSDHIKAALSPGEFVMDAETVSLLGNGDNEAGARKLEDFRQNLRKQKGEALAKGKFSPDAKATGSYFNKKS